MLFVELDRLLPTPYEALPGANVRLGFGRLNLLDVGVLSEPKDTALNQAADVPLVAEVDRLVPGGRAQAPTAADPVRAGER